MAAVPAEAEEARGSSGSDSGRGRGGGAGRAGGGWQALRRALLVSEQRVLRAAAAQRFPHTEHQLADGHVAA
eukprot:2841773-Rhodomonas_salina.2